MSVHEEPPLWGVAAAAGLSLVMLPLSINWCVKAKAKVSGRKPGESHYRSATWLLVYTLVNVAGWILIFHLGSMAAGGEQFDPYEVLDIDEDATVRDVKKSYRKLSLLHHPDKGGKEADFQKINMAYRTLTDPVSRQNYALFGHPDGRQGITAGIGLPDFMMDKDNSLMLVFFYMILLIGAPAFCFFGGGLRKAETANQLATAQKEALIYFATHLSPNDTLPALLAIVAGVPCLLTGADGSKLTEEALAAANHTAQTMEGACFEGLSAAACVPLRQALAACEHAVHRLNLLLLVAHTTQRSVGKDGTRLDGTALRELQPAQRARLQLLLAAAPQLVSAVVKVHSERGWFGGAQQAASLSQSLASGMWPQKEAENKLAQKQLLKLSGHTLPSCTLDASVEVEDEPQIAEGDTVSCTLTFKRQNKGYPDTAASGQPLILSGLAGDATHTAAATQLQCSAQCARLAALLDPGRHRQIAAAAEEGGGHQATPKEAASASEQEHYTPSPQAMALAKESVARQNAGAESWLVLVGHAAKGNGSPDGLLLASWLIVGPPEAPEPSSCVHRWKQPKGEGRFKATALVESLHFWGAGCQRTLAFEVMSEYDLAVQEFAAQNHMGDHKADGGSDDDGGGDELGD